MNCTLDDIASRFGLSGNIKAFGDGHINDTYLLTDGENRFVIQRINHYVFKNPENIMSNIMLVTEHLRNRISAEGGDPERETLTYLKTTDGKACCKTPDGNYYRAYRFVEGARSYEKVEKPEHFYNAAKAFGHFQKLLSDFPADRLYETIPDFHNTVKRYETFEKAVKDNLSGRASEADGLIAFARERKEYSSKIVNAIENGEIPLRVTHNDTKYNNILIDDKTGKAICIIDLDTVMPGSLLYDYGDCIRFGASTAAEDEQDISKIHCDMNLFEQFTRGFIEETGDSLTETEKELLPFSVILITYELGIRFLSDYLDGDKYFKVSYPEHNRVRAAAQFALVSDMESHLGEMQSIAKKYYAAEVKEKNKNPIVKGVSCTA